MARPSVLGDNAGSIPVPASMPKKIEARQSDIHGNGVFAIADIK